MVRSCSTFGVYLACTLFLSYMVSKFLGDQLHLKVFKLHISFVQVSPMVRAKFGFFMWEFNFWEGCKVLFYLIDLYKSTFTIIFIYCDFVILCCCVKIETDWLYILVIPAYSQLVSSKIH